MEDTEQDRKWLGDSVALSSESLSCHFPSVWFQRTFLHSADACKQLPCARRSLGSRVLRDNLAVEWMGHRICVVLMERGLTQHCLLRGFHLASHAHAPGFLKWLRPKGMEFQSWATFKAQSVQAFLSYTYEVTKV